MPFVQTLWISTLLLFFLVSTKDKSIVRLSQPTSSPLPTFRFWRPAPSCRFSLPKCSWGKLRNDQPRYSTGGQIDTPAPGWN